MEYFNCTALTTARRKRGLTTLQVARLLGKSKPTVWKYENGEIDLPVSCLFNMVNLYECSVNDLIDHSDEKQSILFSPERMKEAREVKGLTAEKVAKRIGVNPAIIVNIELGRISPRPEFALRLAKMYSVDVQKFIIENTKGEK